MRTLIWRQSKHFDYCNYEVLDNGKVIGRMYFYGRRSMEAETTDSKWTFKLEGFLEDRIEIYKDGSSEKLILKLGSFFNPTGTLTYDNKKLLLISLDWAGSYGWFGEDKKEILSFKDGQFGEISIENSKQYDYQFIMLLVFLAIFRISIQTSLPVV